MSNVLVTHDESGNTRYVTPEGIHVLEISDIEYAYSTDVELALVLSRDLRRFAGTERVVRLAAYKQIRVWLDDNLTDLKDAHPYLVEDRQAVIDTVVQAWKDDPTTPANVVSDWIAAEPTS